VLVSFTGELFRPDTDVAVTYAGSARIEVGFGPTGPETVTTTGLARYLIDLDGNRIVFDAGFFTGDFSSDPPTLIEHGLKRYEEVICGALAQPWPRSPSRGIACGRRRFTTCIRSTRPSGGGPRPSGGHGCAVPHSRRGS
jgi:hypothetical protein